VNKSEFLAELEGKDVTLVKYSASWCAPCRVLAPIVTTFVEESQVPFLAVDIDDSTDLCVERSVRGVPRLEFVDPEGNVLEQVSGVVQKDAIHKLYASALAKVTK
jgi:thioredoxin 1